MKTLEERKKDKDVEALNEIGSEINVEVIDAKSVKKISGIFFFFWFLAVIAMFALSIFILRGRTYLPVFAINIIFVIFYILKYHTKVFNRK